MILSLSVLFVVLSGVRIIDRAESLVAATLTDWHS
jgi:hypothetical protein